MPQTHDIVLWGQGEMHLRVALERLRDRFGVNVKSQPPAIGYQETIRKSITQRGRHKKQSGGHGQFGDVVLEIKPMPRGSGFEFHEKVVGGAVPRNYIGAVEEGVVDGLLRGPLGFPVIDVHVTLIDGSYHSVDSSDLAFRTAARVGVSEALPQCQPVLLEPIHLVEIVCPTDATARINAILSGRRGQILGFDTREGWSGMGLCPRHDAGSGDRRSDRRIAVGHGRRRQFYPAVRPHGRRRGRPGRRGGGRRAHRLPRQRVSDRRHLREPDLGSRRTRASCSAARTRSSMIRSTNAPSFGMQQMSGVDSIFKTRQVDATVERRRSTAAATS